MKQMLSPAEPQKNTLGKKVLIYGCLPLIILFVGLVILGALVAPTEKKAEKADNHETAEVRSIDTEKPSNVIKEQLERELATLNKPHETHTDETTVEQLQWRIVVLAHGQS